MAVSADRNLLFGILALQMDFISREQLIAGMQAWVLAKDVPLAEHMIAAGALLPEHRDLLDPLVRAHIRQHGDDPRRSLVAASLAGWVPPQLAALDDAQVQASLGHLPRRPSPASDPLATLAVPPESVHETGSRFFVLRPHAEGGLGRVLVARDEELHREVALKEIRPEYAEDPTFRARFTLEAEITGGLEHPGIVPVYALGTHPDGSPYYVMRFIKGESLKDVIDAFHAASVSRSPSRQALELRKLLARFIDVCQAVGYAHSRGVLHRDLKPSNIMLGKYGETLVVDWGLAKTSRRSEPSPSADPEQTLHPTSASTLEPTQMGSTVGTVGYMSPEQAQGRLDLLSPASDVFSLGATLYHLLTGQSPLSGAPLDELLPKARSGEFPRPRSIQRNIPPALEAICLKALANDPAERYASAAALVDDVEHWLADEPVSACRETISERLARLARRHRTGLQAGIAALVLLSVVSSITAFVVNAARQQAVAAAAAERVAREEERQAKERERLAKEEERQAKEQAQTAREQEHAARQLAEKRLAQVERGAEILGTVFHEINPETEEPDRPPLLERLGDQLRQASAQVEQDAVGDPLIVARLQTILGRSLVELGHADKALEPLEKALATRRELLGLEARDTLTTLDEFALAQLASGHFSEARPLFEECLARRQATLGLDDLDTLRSLHNMSRIHRQLGEFEPAIASIKQCLAGRRAQLGADHPESLLSLASLAAAELEAGQVQQALPLFEECYELSRAKLGMDHADALLAMNNLAQACRRAGQLERAISLNKECLERRREKFGPRHPLTLTSLSNLAAARYAQGDIDQALALFVECWELRRARQGADHPDTLTALNNLAVAHKSAGEPEKALALHTECLTLRRAKLGTNHPATLMSLSNLAEAHRALDQADQAVPLIEECFERRKAVLGPDHPTTLATLSNLAAAYRAVGQHGKAADLLEQCLDWQQKKLGTDHRETLLTMNNLAEAWRAVGQREQAQGLHRQCWELRRAKLGVDHPETLLSLYNLGLGHQAAGEYMSALPLLEECFSRRQQRQGPDATATLQSLRSYAVALAQCGQAAEAGRRFDQLQESLSKKSGADAASQWRSLLSAGLELAGTTPEYALARNCVEGALQQREAWKPTAAELLDGALCRADCTLLLEEYAAAEQQYDALRQSLLSDAREHVVAWVHLGWATALVGAGKLADAKPALSDQVEPLLRMLANGPPSQRRPLLGIGRLLVKLLHHAGDASTATKWEERFKALDQAPSSASATAPAKEDLNPNRPRSN